jgi:hypothetical protein
VNRRSLPYAEIVRQLDERRALYARLGPRHAEWAEWENMLCGRSYPIKWTVAAPPLSAKHRLLRNARDKAARAARKRNRR